MKTFTALTIALSFFLAACAPAALEATTAPGATVPIEQTAVPATVVLATAVGRTDAAPTPVAATNSTDTSVPGITTVVAASGSTAAPVPTQAPPTPIPALASGFSPTELKYRVLAEHPDLFFCDKDFYPVARGDEGDQARLIFPELQSNAEEFQAILSHNGMAGLATFSDNQKLVVYREHKRLAAVLFTLSTGRYQYQLRTKDSQGQGQLITGSIDGTGAISAENSQPAITTCPICLAAQTQIDTPRGPVAVNELHAGDTVWTVDATGARVSATILQTVRVFVPADHQMVHVVLDDGRELWASPGHPTTDGRALGNLKPGDQLDGARIVRLERVPYDQPATYDLLPSGATGFYWANGILMGSTLARR